VKECSTIKYGTANLYRITNGENRGQVWSSTCSQNRRRDGT
jgi:hypothetical protein